MTTLIVKQSLTSNIDTDLKAIDISELSKKNNYFQYIQENTPCRVFFDLDGYYHEEDFTDKNIQIIEKLKTIADVALITSSSCAIKKKLSYHIYLNNYTESVKEIVNDIKFMYGAIFAGLLKNIINVVGKKDESKTGIEIDTSIYKRGVLRCPNAFKTADDKRYNKVIFGDVNDCIIHTGLNLDNIYKPTSKITTNCELLPNKQSVIAVHPCSNNTTIKYETLLTILSDTRASHRDDWLKVGMALKNEDDNLLELYNDFSKRGGSSYKGLSDVSKTWNSFKRSGLTIATIIKFAMEDNKELTVKWIKDNNVNSYESMKLELEKYLFFVENPVCYGYEKDGLIIYNLKDLKQLLKPYKIEKKEFVDLWLEDPTRRSYKKFDFVPNSTKADFYNHFQGFKYNNDKPIDYTKIQPFLTLISDLLNNEECSITAFLDWMAWIRQYPEKKSEKAVVLYSEMQGVGKNTIIELLTRTIGYSTTINDIKDLVRNFNTHLTNKLIIYGDEVKVKAREIRDDLKNLITKKEMIAEKKGIDAYKVADYSNYIFTSNNQNAFYIEPTDRRFILLELQNKVMTPEMSSLLYGLLDQQETLESFDTFLKSRVLPDKLGNLNNAYKKLLIEQSLPAYIQMMYRNTSKFYDRDFTTADLLEASIDYAKKHNMESTFSPKKFQDDFKKTFGKFHKKSGMFRGYRFPSNTIFDDFLRQQHPDLFLE